MRILHTSDWHLGKTLEGFSRLEEQELFIEELVEKIEENNIDLVIIAGDIYDNGNPPAKAENLFYNAIKRISGGGKRAVLVIAGNHDNPERLVAASPLAYEHGVIMLGTPKSCALTGRFGNFEIVEAGEGFVEIDVNKERAVVLTLPYPSEKRLNEILTEELEEAERRRSYSERVGEIFNRLSEKYREDTINLAVSHIFVAGGESSDSERPIQLGGSLTVDAHMLPKKAQYIALGHLHRPQRVKAEDIEAYYAGSPLQYSKSEINYSKCSYIVDLKAGEKAKIEQLFFKNHKPIEVWKCKCVEDAIEKCRENSERNVWVYLEIETDKFITQENIKLIKELKKDIIEILPVIDGQDETAIDYETLNEKSMADMFKEFYLKERKVEPSNELMDLFLRIAQEEEEGANEA
ncbi:exonuclease SbcCD, D subunit [Clostridiales bacterium oral taxon 876 str. F0540]|nr:exonuclease SbcCD, D subunit [Clostridiales bacterium oral taxon 876 str. F0540]